MSATDGPSPATGGSTTGFGWSTGRRSSCVEPEPLELQEPLEPPEPRAAGLSHRALRAPPGSTGSRGSGVPRVRVPGVAQVSRCTLGTPETLEPEPSELQEPLEPPEPRAAGLSLVAKGDRWIDPRRAARGDEACKHGDADEKTDDGEKRRRIGRTDAVQDAGDQPRRDQRGY